MTSRRSSSKSSSSSKHQSRMPLSRRSSEESSSASSLAAMAANSSGAGLHPHPGGPPGPPGFTVVPFTTSSAASTYSYSSQDVDDQRFSELLKPIKDLTVNWEVPLARYLEEYIEGLDISNLASSNHKVNFVEAALLLQGTASVYSKKVEFLWQNTLKMLDLLASRKALEEATEGTGAEGKGGRRRKGPGHDFNDFRPVVSDMTKTVNMKDDAALGNAACAATREKKAAALNFISVTPRQLIEKEGREQRGTRVNLYAKGGGLKDLIGHKEDFRVNAQFSLTTATVGEDLNEECDLSQHSVSLFEDSVSFMETSLLQPIAEGVEAEGASAAAAAAAAATATASPSAKSSPGAVLAASTSHDPAADAAAAAAAAATAEQDQPVAEDLGPGGVDYDDADQDLFAAPLAPPPPPPSTTEPGGGGAAETPTENILSHPDTEGQTELPQQEERRSTRARRNKLQESLEEPRAPLVGPWEPVRPEEALVPAKPVRKGKTCRVPKGSGLELSNSRKYKTTAAERRRRFREKQGIPDDGSSSRVQVTAPIEQYLIREHTAMGRCRQVAPEFRDKAVAEEKERQQKALQVEAEMEKGAGGAQGEEDREEDRREDQVANDDVGGGGGDNDDGWEDFQGGVDFGDPALGDQGGEEEEEDDARRHNDEEILKAMLPEEEESNGAASRVSYEELVMKRVSEYVQQSQEYIESTDLAKRVSRWHADIRPRLNSVERRGNFDIHRYGSDIIGSFPGPGQGPGPGPGSASHRQDGGGGGMSKSAKSTVSFEECVRGKEREEICRYFLSALMLANTSNIELSSGVSEDAQNESLMNVSAASGDDPSTPRASKLRKKKKKDKRTSSAASGRSGRTAEALPMDHVEMTLLSTVRHHEVLQGYHAPSEEGEEEEEEEEAAVANGDAASDDDDDEDDDDEPEVIRAPKRRRKTTEKGKGNGKGKGKGKQQQGGRKRKLETVQEEEEEEGGERGSGLLAAARENGVA